MHSSTIQTGKQTRCGQLTTQSPEYRSTGRIDASVYSTRRGLVGAAITSALVLMLVALWPIMHRYSGLDRDAQIYAFQALARIHPAFTADLYLQNTSQDQYTIFSPFYASFIGLLGLENAARLLTVLFTVWFLAAAWGLASTLVNRDNAWLVVALMIILPGEYGAYGVFRFSEQYLTARLPAEALALTALFCHYRGLKRLGLSIAAAAMFVHPIMALPAFLLLICLWLSNRVSSIGALGGVFAALCISVAAVAIPAAAHVIPVMDAPWFEVVRERSQFLFLQYWPARAWDLNARPFICLMLAAAAFQDPRIRKISVAAMLVGACGLAVGFIGSAIGPMAILVQGQAWRWIWITGFVAVLLLAPTAFQVWRDERCGPICAVLLISGWTVSAVDGTACASLALILWLIRPRISDRAAIFLRWAAVALGAMIVAWVLAKSWTIVSSASVDSAREPLLLTRIRNIAGLEISAVLVVGLLWWWIRRSRRLWIPVLAAAVLLASSIFIFPASFRPLHSVGSAAPEINAFADWQKAIPPKSNVFIVPTLNSGSFAWFTLERPNYLWIDTSAGVVFSRATALEVQRRSDVLLPLMDPDWKILTGMRHSAGDKQEGNSSSSRSLTAKTLISICGDPRLGFVISKEDVGFDPMRHTRPGRWKDWNLYDCRHVRSRAPTT